jgi:Lysylphosphatidylglycerol synthase TM region
MSAPAPSAAARRGLWPSFALSYLIGFGLIALLVYYAGIWNILANTRILDLLTRGGIVALTDADQGLVYGVPDTEYYVASQDPVDWDLVLIAGLLFLVMWGIKSLQFHELARFAGVDGAIGQHTRAYLYGRGINRVFPYGIGNVAAASALEGQGADRGRVPSVLFLAQVFAVFEVIAFGLYGLFAVGLMGWAGEIFWPLVILLVAYLMTRPERPRAKASRRETAIAARRTLRVLARRPGTFARLTVMSLLSFLLIDVGAYLISQSFTSPNVILNVTFAQLTMGIVAGYAARLITLTPGGLGQWEWGCAAALYVSGLGFPEAATIAILVSMVRYLVGGLLFAIVALGPGVETSLRATFARFRGEQPEPEPVAP